MNQLSRPIPQGTTQVPVGLNISTGTRRPLPARKESLHKSTTSDSTTFEDETTPEEEIDRQLRLRRAEAYNASQYSDGAPGRAPEGDTSPIKNLAYPPVPQPAAISRQAQQVPRPLAGQTINTSGSAPVGVSRGLSQRHQLNRAGQSYLLSETTSSSAGAPSLLAQRRLGQQKDLRINAAVNALNSRWQVSTQPNVPPVIKQGVSETTPNVRVTPKTNSRGDLYLTVED